MMAIFAPNVENEETTIDLDYWNDSVSRERDGYIDRWACRLLEIRQ